MRFKKITWWPQAYHVFNDEKRLGIVTAQHMQQDGRDRVWWLAYTASMVNVDGQYDTRKAAALALPTRYSAVQLKGKTLPNRDNYGIDKVAIRK